MKETQSTTTTAMPAITPVDRPPVLASVVSFAVGIMVGVAVYVAYVVLEVWVSSCAILLVTGRSIVVREIVA